MAEFGHVFHRGGGICIDTWGAGPFILEVAGKTHRFEDSDRFGPSRVNKNGEISANPWWGARHPFWPAHRLWVAQGRRVAADGVTCIWSAARPTIVRTIKPGHALLVAEGEDDGLILELETPEGQRALEEWAYPHIREAANGL